MKIAIVLSSPPVRQVFRGIDVRGVAIVAERAMWPLLEAGQPVVVTVQCGNARLQAQVNQYFNDLIQNETQFLSSSAVSKASRHTSSPSA